MWMKHTSKCTSPRRKYLFWIMMPFNTHEHQWTDLAWACLNLYCGDYNSYMVNCAMFTHIPLASWHIILKCLEFMKVFASVSELNWVIHTTSIWHLHGSIEQNIEQVMLQLSCSFARARAYSYCRKLGHCYKAGNGSTVYIWHPDRATRTGLSY